MMSMVISAAQESPRGRLAVGAVTDAIQGGGASAGRSAYREGRSC